MTGSGRGIGKGIAIRLAREGMKVVINSRTVENEQTLAGELRACGAEALPVPCDAGSSAGIDTLFKATLDAFGTVSLEMGQFSTVDNNLIGSSVFDRQPMVESSRQGIRASWRLDLLYTSDVTNSTLCPSLKGRNETNGPQNDVRVALPRPLQKEYNDNHRGDMMAETTTHR